MATAIALNPEPSRPEEREEQHLPPKSYSDAAQEPPPASYPSKTNGMRPLDPPTPPEYSGAGMGDAPQSPGRGHKRVSSKPSDSKLNGNGNVQKERMSENGSIVREKYVSANGSGDLLTSIKPSDDFEEELRQDETERKKRRGELVTGRRAGAGWERSKYGVSPRSFCANANAIITGSGGPLSMSLYSDASRPQWSSSTPCPSPSSSLGSSGFAQFHCCGR